MRTNLAQLLSYGLAGTCKLVILPIVQGLNAAQDNRCDDRASLRGWDSCPARTTAPDKNLPAREMQVSSTPYQSLPRAASSPID
jgi:hypothetical protein